MKLISRWIQTGLIALVVFFSLVQPVLATTVVNPRDIMTRQQVSVESIHQIRFVSPTGAMDSSDTITLTFPSGFDLSTLTYSAIQLASGNPGSEAPRTVAATPGVGTWGASISGQTITLTASTNPAGGSGISGGKTVLITIGGAAGSRIINPSSVGTYTVAIAGTFGDRGLLFLPIRSSDTETISAVVPSVSAGGGGGTVSGDGGAGPGAAVPPTIDGAAPVISGVQAIHVSTSSVDIIWDTDEAADSKVEYGTTPVLLSTALDGSRVVSHSVHLTGLTPSTNYVFRVSSADAVGNTAVGSVFYPFRTTDLIPDPILSGFTVAAITDRSAIITWETDIDATTILQYGIAPLLSSVRDEGAIRTRLHRVALEGLTPGTTYAVRARSVTAAGRSVESMVAEFMTLPDASAPSNPFGFSATGGRGLVTLVWTNPTDADFSKVVLVARTDRFPTSITDGRLVYNGAGTGVIDAGLIDGTTYYYTIFSLDTSNNASSGSSASATTLRVATTEPAEPPVAPFPATSTPPIVVPSATSSRPGEGTALPTSTSTRPVTGDPSVASSTIRIESPLTGATTTPPIIEVSTASSSLPVPPVIEAAPIDGTNSTTSSQPSVSATIESNELSFVVYAREGLVELIPDAQGRLHSFPSQALTLRIPLAGLPSEPQSGVLTVGSSRYLLSLNSSRTYLETTFIPGTHVENVRMDVDLVLSGGRRRSGNRMVRLDGFGTIYEQTLLARNETTIEGAEIRLFRQQSGVWTLADGAQLGLSNPVMTDRGGSYGYLVPNGWYQVRVKKEGYRETVQEIAVRNNILNTRIGLKKELKSVSELINPNASVGENLKAVGEQAAIITEDVREVIQAPQVQEATQNVVAPTVVAVTAASTATAVTGFNLLNYLRFLMTQPLLLIGRRKRKKWGTVYNALSKQPIELAIVRLLNAKTRLVVQTRITDAQGRFSFTVPAGEYIIQTVKPGFGFPTKYLGESREDGDFLDLYHGESILVKESSAITPNIPIDPAAKEETPKQVLRKAMWRKLQKGLSVGGIVVSFAALAIQPSLLMGGFIVFQVGSYFLFKRLAIPPKPKEWGIAYNADSKKPLEKTIVRIFDKKFNKLLETQVTDKDGKYGFFAGKGLYYVTAEKVGFEKIVTSDLDFTKAQEAFVDQKLALKPLK